MLLILVALAVLALVARAAQWNMGMELTANEVLKHFMIAIARAEGYFVPNSLPAIRNNPGSIVANGELVTYATPEDGFAALYHQVWLMFRGTPDQTRYSASMTIYQVAVTYTGGDNPAGWAQTVAQYMSEYLGRQITPATELREIA